MEQVIENDVAGDRGKAALAVDCESNEHYAFWRQHFEGGCRCIHFGELKILPSTVDDREAMEHYEANCQCSRNPSVSRADGHG